MSIYGNMTFINRIISNYFFKFIFSSSARGTTPICWQFFERAIVVFFGVIDIATNNTAIFLHNAFSPHLIVTEGNSNNCYLGEPQLSRIHRSK